MDMSSGQSLSGNLTENQELDSLAAALLSNQGMDNLILRGPSSGQSGGRVVRNEQVQFMSPQPPLGAVGPHTATPGLGDAGIWAPATCTSMGPRPWGLPANGTEACEVGMDPLPALEGPPTVSQTRENAGNKEWMLKKRQEMLEKNRRNQKKFRERQKAKMVGLEHQVHLLSAQVQRLRFENSSLANQNELLSKVLVMKEGQVKVLRHESKAKEDSQKPSDQDACTPCSMRGVLGAEGANESASKYTTEVVMKMSLDDVCEKYKEYVQTLSKLLVLAETPGGYEEAEKEISKAMLDLAELLSKLVVLKPEHGAMFVGRNFEFGRTEPPSVTEAQRGTEGVLRSLGLTDAQRKSIVALYRQFQAHLQRIKDKRQHLNSALQDQLAVAREQYVPGIGMHRTARATVEIDEVTQELKDTVEFERHEYANLVSAFFGLILNPVQSAKTIVHSYPYYPDVMGLAILVVQSIRQDDAECSERESGSTWVASTQ